MSARRLGLAFCAVAPLMFAGEALGQAAAPAEVAPVVVVGVTPLGGELNAEKIAAPIHCAPR